MKTNLLRTQNPPLIAYLCETSLQLSVFLDGEFRLSKHKIDYNNLGNGDEMSFDITSRSKLVIILADELLLYSQQQLPSNLTDQEITELISVQKSQQRDDSRISTYYDYFRLRELDASVVFGLFEARKDKLNKIIALFEKIGVTVCLLVPQLIVIINRILFDKSDYSDTYYIVCNLNRTVFIIQINHHNVVNINQIHLNQNQPDSAIYTEIAAYLDEINTELVVLIGLDLAKCKKQIRYFENQSSIFESAYCDQNLDFLSISWMAQQYGLYKSITLA